jgi:hypothetical protein
VDALVNGLTTFYNKYCTSAASQEAFKLLLRDASQDVLTQHCHGLSTGLVIQLHKLVLSPWVQNIGCLAGLLDLLPPELAEPVRSKR